MIRALIEQTFDATKKYYVMCGLSTDTKPTSGLITGSEFHEVDTGVKYEFDEVGAAWHDVGITEQEIKAEIDAWLDDHPEATTTVEDGAISYAKLNSSLQGTVDDVADLKTEMEQKANVDGSYSTLTAGNAEQLVSTVGVNDKTPYLFRTTGGSADVGDRVKLSEITGGTVAWNQLCNYGEDTSLTSAAFPVGTNIVSGHKYLLSCARDIVTEQVVIYLYCRANNENSNQKVLDYSGSANRLETIFSSTLTFTTTAASPNTNGSAWLYRTASSVNTAVTKLMFIDLTAMFGSTIADYLYTLESGTAGAGVAKLKSWGFCTKDYYAYDAGSLLSVKTSAHREIGFNQFNGTVEVGKRWQNGSFVSASGNGYAASSTKIKCVPNTTYCFAMPNETAQANLYINDFDANGNWIRANPYVQIPTTTKYNTFTTNGDAHYIALSLYRATDFSASEFAEVNVNLHWDGERDGEYEPYEEHSYPLDDVELRGIPKLDASNNLYYDGDSYAPDGTVERKYGIVDLGTLGWAQGSTNTTGAYRWYASVENNDIKKPADALTLSNLVCSKYLSKTGLNTYQCVQGVSIGQNDGKIYLYDDALKTSTAQQVATALNGVYLVYELETATTESADPYQETQICSDWGSEEFVDSRTVPMPVGYSALYQANLRAKLEMAPDSPSGDGDYIVRQTDGVNSYVLLEKELPTAPAEDGTYSLKCTVADGTATMSWVADS